MTRLPEMPGRGQASGWTCRRDQTRGHDRGTDPGDCSRRPARGRRVVVGAHHGGLLLVLRSTGTRLATGALLSTIPSNTRFELASVSVSIWNGAEPECRSVVLRSGRAASRPATTTFARMVRTSPCSKAGDRHAAPPLRSPSRGRVATRLCRRRGDQARGLAPRSQVRMTRSGASAGARVPAAIASHATNTMA